TRLGIDQLDRASRPGNGQQPAVGSKGHEAGHVAGVRVASNGLARLPASHVPEAVFLTGPGDQPAAVGTKGGAGARGLHQPVLDDKAGVRVPETDAFALPATCGRPAAVSTQRNVVQPRATAQVARW